MNKGISKWPARALNLLVVLAMVISLCTILAPAALAQEPSIDVAIGSPQDQSIICISQNFLVSGNVTNDGVGNLLGVTVRINSSIFDNGFATVVGGPDTYPLTIGTLVEGESVAYCWTLHCDSGGEMNIEVIAESTSGGNGGISDTETVTVYQDPPCLVDVSTYYVNDGQLVLNPDNKYGTGSIFYINGAVSNATSGTWTNVTTEITGVDPWNECANSEKIEFANTSESTTKIIGDINSKEVGDSWWKVHCCKAGESRVTVTAYGNKTVDDQSVWGVLCSKTITITQTGEVITQNPDVGVTILEPIQAEASFCKGQIFVVKAQICNLTDYDMAQVNATIVYDHAVLQRIYPTGKDDDTIELGALEPNGGTNYCETVGWQMECIGTGNTTIQVIGQSLGLNSGQDSVSVYQADSASQLNLDLHIDKETVCAGCQQVFTITAEVCNLGCHPAAGVRATLSIDSGDPNTVQILDDLGQDLGVLGGFGTADGCGTAVWHIKCLGEGNLTFMVELDGYDSVTTLPIQTSPETVDIRQVSLVTTIIDPAGEIPNVCGQGNDTVQGRVVSVGQQYYIEASVKNCSGSERTNVLATITLPAGVQLDDTQLVRVQRISPNGNVLETYTRTNAENIYIDKICSCCKANVRWPVQCAWRSDDPTTPCLEGQAVTVTAEDEGDTDSDSVTIVQQCKAHLMAGMVAFSGVFSDGTGIYNGDSSFQTTRALVVGKNQKFSLVVPVSNIGQSPASNVVVTLIYTGDATLTGSLTRTIGDIPGRSTRKAIYEFQCTAAGTVSFDIANLTGNDVNWGQAIHTSNINFACTLDIVQVEASWTVEIINPIENELIEVSTDFAVKAKITNDGSAPLTDVTATLSWGTDVNASNLNDAELLTTVTQSRVQSISEIMPGWYEIVWNLHCTAGSPGAGTRLNIKVCAAAAGFADSVCDTTYVRQWIAPTPPPVPGINVRILSPGHCTVVYTGETFLVTAYVEETHGVLAPDVAVVLTTSLGTILDDPWWDVGDIPASADSVSHSWRVKETDTHELRCTSGIEHIQLYGYIDGHTSPDDDSYLSMEVEPAAHLVTDVTFTDMQDNPVTSIIVGSQFKVKADVTNVGEGDAWNVMATLSVSPGGSVMPATGEVSFISKPVEGDLGNNLVGWNVDETGTVEWTVVCMAAGQSVITVTPSGMDECGWQPKDPEVTDGPCSAFQWVKLPGDVVQPRNIVADSNTVEQVVSQPPDTSISEFDISLANGWNLISLPLIPDEPGITDVLSGVWANFDRAFAYNPGPVSYIKGGPPPSLTEMTTGLGYWIKMTGPAVLTVEGQFQPDPPALPKSYEVNVGWNLIGFHSTGAMTASDYLGTDMVGKWARIWGYANGQYSPVASTGMLQPGFGYWLAVTTDGTIYP